MTRSDEKGKKPPGDVKKLSLKKETVKDLDAGRDKGQELGDDQLEAVNGGQMKNQNIIPKGPSNACVGKPPVLPGTRPACIPESSPGGICHWP